jgi:eukaryotic-like serine/threonine-protein kinase
VTESASPLALGVVLDGRYRVHGVLGQGGMGHVYAGEDLRLGRQVAIKVAHEAEPELMLGERLFREAKAAARADHPAVITAYGYGTDSELGVDYFVMERLYGETVGQRIERVGRLPVPLVLRIAIETCDALIAVHSANVIHRDLKPSNIFLAQRGQRVDEIKLLDFGVAKQLNLQTLTATGQVYGTPMYMAPEQLTDSKHVDVRCDVYSLGAVMLECLTGKPPFVAANTFALALEVVYGAEPDVRGRCSDVSEELAAVVSRCLKKQRESRFPDARAVYLALGKLAP